MRKISKRTAVVLGIAGVVVVTGVAYAAWTSTGAGSGTVNSTTSVNSTITGSGSTGLYPGATKTFDVSINNPNAYPVVVNSIDAGASLVNGSCAAASVTSAALSPAVAVVPAGGSGSYTLTVHMIADPSDDCQGKDFTLPLTAHLSSAAS